MKSTSAVDIKQNLLETIKDAGVIQRSLLTQAPAAILDFVGVSLPVRIDVENKILQAYFCRFHDLPEKFDYAVYLTVSFKVLSSTI